MAGRPEEDDEQLSDDEDEPDTGILDDFTTYLESLISRKENGSDIHLKEKMVVKFLKKAEVKFLGFCNDSAPKPKPNEPKRLISSKTSVFRNRSGKQAQYILRACAEDAVFAQVKTTKGFSLGVATGMTLGAPTGGAGLLLGGVFKREKEKTQGSKSISRREMEANAPVDCEQQLVATESVYHTDYEATCLFDFLIKEDYKISYKAASKSTTKKVKELGFKMCEQDLEGAGSSGKKVHTSAFFRTTLTSTQHHIDFKVEPISAEETDNY